jgi:hypothetical protein
MSTAIKEVTSAAAWAAKDAEPTKPLLTALLTLPSGAVVEVCRPDISVWFASGALPQVFVDKLLNIEPYRSEAETRLAEAAMREEIAADPIKTRQLLIFQREVVRAALVRPRIKVGAKGDDEIEPSAVPREDFLFIYNHVLAGSPAVTVQTEESETTVEAVETFPAQPGLSRNGDDVSQAKATRKSKNAAARRGTGNGR